MMKVTTPSPVAPAMEDLETLAKRANQVMRDRVEGFVECRVHRKEPPVLAFQFIGPLEAHKFWLMKRTDASSPFQYTMAPGRVDTVLEHR